MNDEDRIKEQIRNDLAQLRHRMTELETSEIGYKRTEKQLRESEERFRAIAEAAKDAIIMVDDEGKISYWNPAAKEIFGLMSQEMIGKDLLIIIPERYHEDYLNGFRAFKETGVGPAIGKTIQSEAVKRDGTEFPIELSISATQINGQWHAVGTARDITDRRRMEEALTEKMKKYQLLLDNEIDVRMLVDIDTKRFLEVNKAAVDLYGYSREEFLQMRATDISAEPDKTDASFKELMEQSAVKIHIFKHKKKDGTIFPAEVTACAFIWKDRKTFCVVVRDITERRWDRRSGFDRRSGEDRRNVTDFATGADRRRGVERRAA